MKRPVQIFSDTPQLNCEYCDKNLLDDNNHGNFIVFYDQENHAEELSCIKYACKEHDRFVTERAREQNLRDAGWDDVDDLLIPTIWIKKLMAFINELYTSRDKVSEKYFNDFKKMFLSTFPYIVREMSQEELERVSKLMQLDF